MKIIGILLLVVVVIYCNIWTYNNNVAETERFALSKKAEIVSIKKHWSTFRTPYYWQNKNTLIWEVKLSNGEIWFMRPRFFSNYDWERNTSSTK